MSKRRFASRKFATWKFASRRFAGPVGEDVLEAAEAYVARRHAADTYSLRSKVVDVLIRRIQPSMPRSG